MRYLAVTICCSFVFAMAALAQSDRGTITGTVMDPARAVVPNAAIVAKNLENGSEYKGVTTDTGNYTLASLPSGSYEVIVEAGGFSKFVQTGIRVLVAQTLRVDVLLQVGSTTESVTVNADAALLRTEGADQSYNLSIARMEALPINFGSRIRNPIGFMVLTPGSSIALTTGEARTSMRINGTGNYQFRVEGQESSSQMNTGAADGYLPSVEALQEVSVQSSNYSAEYGQVGGGLFNFTTRSGTNEYHGGAYEYLSNEFLNAGIPFTDAGNGELSRPSSRKSDFGGTFGSAVRIPKIYDGRNKTFFFFNVERYRERAQRTGQYGSVPTALMRQGNFSEILTGRVLNTDPLGRSILENTIYDPTTRRTISTGQVVTDPYPGNAFSPTLFDPVAAKVQALIPQATRSGIVSNFLQQWFNIRDFGTTSLKFDHNIGNKLKTSMFYSRWTYGNNYHSPPDGLPDLITISRPMYSTVNTVRVNLDYTVSPTMLIHAGAGFIRNYQPDTARDLQLNYDAVKELGLVGSATTPAGFPLFNGLSNSFGGAQTMGTNNANQRTNDKPSAVVSANLIRGSHSYKWGGEFRIDIFYDNPDTAGSHGNYNFAAAETGLPSTQGQSLGGGTVGHPYASFLLGRVDSATVNAVKQVQYRKNSWGFYAQDTWKITRKLTLDYGLRWDYQKDARELNYRMSMFDPSIKNPSAGGLLGGTRYPGYGPGRCNCPVDKSYPWSLGPRLGVAYQINPKTVLRAGWGIVYGATAIIGYAGDTVPLGVGWDQLSFATPSYGDAAVILRNGLQWTPAQLYTPTFDPGVRPSPGQVNSPPTYWDPNGSRPSRIHQWNIGFQRQITNDLTVEAAYVGNRSVWNQASGLLNWNELTIQRLSAFGLDINNAADRTLLTSRLDSSTAISRGFGNLPYASYPKSVTVAQSLRPFPQFGTIGNTHTPNGTSTYDSLQAKLTKRLSHGLDTTVSFTWAKEMIRGGTVNYDYGNSRLFLPTEIDGSSQPFILAVGVNYEVPGLSVNRWTRAITRGWTLGGIFRDSSGLPIAAPGSQGNLNSLIFRSTTAIRVDGQPLYLKDLNCHCIDPNKDFVLNKAAWTEPAAGQFSGSSSKAYYNDYRVWRIPDEQITIGRTFHIRERMTFQIRAEFFNALNRTRLVSPQSTNASQTKTVNAQGVTVSGFGRIDIGGRDQGQSPRTGQLIARFQF